MMYCMQQGEIWFFFFRIFYKDNKKCGGEGRWGQEKCPTKIIVFNQDWLYKLYIHMKKAPSLPESIEGAK